MDEAMREQARAFAAQGLKSLEQEDMPDAQGNLVSTQEALRDRKAAEACCSREELAELDRVLKEVETFPKVAANAQDSLLDLEGIRCYPAGRFLIFYRYNSTAVGDGDPAGTGPSGMELPDPGWKEIPLKFT